MQHLKKNEISMGLSANVDLKELRRMIDYLKVSDPGSSPNETQQEIDRLSDVVNERIWGKIEAQRNLS